MPGGWRLIGYSEDYLTRKFKKYVRAAGLNDALTFHCLRHTFATWLANVGVKSSSVQQLLGHADPASTRIYVHLMEEDLSRDIAKLTLPRN